MNEDVLMHSGRGHLDGGHSGRYPWGSGAKWGKPSLGERRYVNPDGTLTKAGQKRYEQDVKANHQKSRKNRVDDEDLIDPNRWVREDITRSKAIADSGKSIASSLKDIEKTTRNLKKTKPLDLSNMSDQELRAKINRELLERQYNQMFNAPEISRGRENVTKVLEIGGSVLAFTGSALGIALAIKELKGKSTP